jgi:hypothetical protein
VRAVIGGKCEFPFLERLGITLHTLVAQQLRKPRGPTGHGRGSRSGIREQPAADSYE